MELAITPISTGAQVYFTAYLRDIGERRQAEAALRESEAQFRAMADNIPQMAWMARPDGSRYWFNRRWCDYTGMPPGQAEGFGWQDSHHADHLGRVLEGMHRAWAKGEPWEDTFPLRGKDGEYRWFLSRAVPVRDAQGQVTLWFGTNTDVTERQAIEAALREESHTLEVLNRTGAALAAELELGSIVQKVTDAATELSGAAFGAFFYNVVEKGKEALTLYTLSGAPREAFSRFPLPSKTAVFAPTFHGEGIVRSDDITADPRYGQNIPHRGMPEGHLPVRSYLAVPVVSRSGEVTGGLFFGHPELAVFTERAERIVAGIAAQAAIAIDNARLYQAAQHEVEARTVAEEELRQLNETLERLVEERTAALQIEVEERRRAEEAARQSEKLAAIGQLTGGIAHDFNNIIQVVASGTTLLRYPGLSEERRGAALDGLTKATESAKELTSRLLAFARKQTLQPEAFDLNERLRGMAEMLRHTLGSRIRVETDFYADIWPVMADPGQFEVAILNLAVNARDAMLPEGGTLTLTTRNVVLEATSEHAAGDYVCLAVQDTGKGMPPAVLARVFEPFFTTKGQAGTGLGLPQVHGFAKQSGGDIDIESVPGQGTTILFHLPRAAVALGHTAPRSALSPAARMEHTAGKTVLVVDDNPDVASFAASMLEELGYTTRRATNAGDALSLLAEDATIHAVFSDVVMPGEMDGVQLASALRLRHPRLAIVLATGYSQVLAEWQGKAVAEVLSKPYRLDDLAAALERALTARATDTKETDAGLIPESTTGESA
ncbi:PAS domain S-box protein [Siccirubricoccus deserti]